jgi:uncharacterized protein
MSETESPGEAEPAVDASDVVDAAEAGTAEADAPPAAPSHARAVLEHVVRAVVSQPDEVAIEESRTRSGALALDVRVAPGDMGRVIGKRGRVAQAIRTVVRAAASRDGTAVEVEFLE